jgi:hypothetical protein
LVVAASSRTVASTPHTLARLFVSPEAAFRDIAAAPRWGPALALLLGMAFVVGALALSRLQVEDVAERALADRQASSAAETAATVAAVSGTMRMMVWTGPLLLVVYHVATSGALFAGLHLLGAVIGFGRVFAIVVCAAVPAGLCKGLIAVAVILRRDVLQLDDLGTLVSLHAGALLPETAPATLVAAATGLDAFTAWKAVWIVIGLSIAARQPRRRVALLVLGMWSGWIALRALLSIARS